MMVRRILVRSGVPASWQTPFVTASSSRFTMSQTRRLRRFTGLTLFALLAVAALSAPMLAQDAPSTYEAGLACFRTGDHDAALAHFEGLLADLSPSDAVTIWQSDPDALVDLMTAGGSFEDFALAVLSTAGKVRGPSSRQVAPADMSGVFGDDFNAREAAIENLRSNYHAFAAPALVKALASQNEERRLAAIYALQRFRSEMVLPLLAAIESENEMVRAGAALALGAVGDSRSQAALTDHAANDDSTLVRTTAAHFAVDGCAATMHYEQGMRFLLGRKGGVSPSENEGVIWYADGNTVAFSEVAEAAVGAEMARREFARAAAMGYPGARIAVAAAYGASLSADGPPDLVYEALALPQADLTAGAGLAAEHGLDGASTLLHGLADRSQVADQLLASVRVSQRPAELPAVIALAEGGESSPTVLAGLMQAAELGTVRAVHLVDADASRRAALTEALQAARVAVFAAQDGAEGLIQLHAARVVDAFVVFDGIELVGPARVVKEIRRVDAFAETPVFLVTTDTAVVEAAGEAAEVVNACDIETILGAFEPLDAQRSSNLDIAGVAADTLAALTRENPAALADFAGRLVGVLGHRDDVAVPSLVMLGRLADRCSAGPICALLADSSRSDTVRSAAAEALGSLAAAGVAPCRLKAALTAAMDGAADPLKRACARALSAGCQDSSSSCRGG